jgi:acetate kinase
VQVYLWRLRKYLGAYLTAVGPADAVIFTDTIGETVPQVRAAACAGMEPFGLEIDPERNLHVTSCPADVAADDSPVRILVIQTNEELAIARCAYSMLAKPANTGGEEFSGGGGTIQTRRPKTGGVESAVLRTSRGPEGPPR